MTKLPPSDLGKAALAYLRQGFSVIPVQADSKAPPMVNWQEYQDRRPSEGEIAAWWTQWPQANVAIVTGAISDLSVIDLDGEAGVQSYLKIMAVMPKTRIHSTPKGKHLLYRHCPGLKQGAGRLPGADVRNDGGYIIAPPSTVDGKPYDVFRDRPIVVLAEPPESLTGKGPKESLTPALIGNPLWVTEALQGGAPESVRNDTAARLIGYFHSKGIPADIVQATMQSFAERCDPPMDPTELRRTISSVLRYQNAAREQRILTPPVYRSEGNEYIYQFEAAQITFRISELAKRRGDLESWLQVTTTLPSHPLSLYGPRNWHLASTSGTENLRKALEKRVPDLDWAGMLDVVSRMTIETYRRGKPAVLMVDVEDGNGEPYELAPLLGTEGLNILYGDGGTGKSYLALGACMSLTSMQKILDLAPARFHRCLYLDWEANETVLRHRLLNLMTGHEIMDDSPLQNIAYLRMEAPLTESVTQIRTEMDRLGSGVVVVDSIGAAISDDMYAPEAATTFANACRTLECTVLAIAHVPKDQANSNRPAKPLGSVYFWNAGRNNWETRLQRETGEDTIDIAAYHRKANDDRLHKPLGWRLSFGNGSARFSSIAAEQIPGFEANLSAYEKVHRYLISEGYRTKQEILAATEMKDGTLRSLISRDKGKNFIIDEGPPWRLGVDTDRIEH